MKEELSEKYIPVIGHVHISPILLRFANEPNIAFALGPKFSSNEERLDRILSAFPQLSSDGNNPERVNGVVRLVNMKDACCLGSEKGILFWAVHSRDPLEFFETEIVQIVTDFCWKSAGRGFATIDFFIHALRTLSITFYTNIPYGIP